MRVLIFSIAYDPFVGGAEVAVKQIANRLPEVEFDMITLNLNGREKDFEKVGNINVYRVRGGKLLFPFLAFFKAVSLHKKNHYDATWSIMANYAGFAALFFKWRFPEVKFILTLQEGDPIEHIRRRVGLLFPLLKQIFIKADKVQAISNFLANWAREMGHTSPVEIVPNGVDVKKFLQTTNYKLQTTGPITLITTSRLVEKNGVGDIIEALKYLPDNVCLKVLGIGPLEIDCKLKIEKWKLEDRVEMLGFIPPEDIPAYLHKADIFVRPALSEGFGNSFVEAMAAGLPVIATPVGGIPDFLDDGVTGFFCEPKNPQSIATAVQRIIDNPALVEEVKCNALEMVEEKYDWDLIAHDMENRVFRPLIR